MRKCFGRWSYCPLPRTGLQSRPAAESTGLEATFPKATPWTQAAPLAGVGSPTAERDILPPDCAASASSSSTDDLDVGIEFSATAAWGDELGLVEERPAPCPSLQALLPRLSWDDELRKPGAQVYMHFMQEHTCYDAMATSSKIVIFDTMLQVRLCPTSILTAPRMPCQPCPATSPFQNSFLAPWRPAEEGFFSLCTPPNCHPSSATASIGFGVGLCASLISKMAIGRPALPYKFQRTPGPTQDESEHFARPELFGKHCRVA